MADLSADAALASGKAQQSELLALQQQVSRLKSDLTPGKTNQQKLRKACNDFEAVFISKMWEQMRNTIPKGGMLHSPQEDMYRSMFDREFSEKLAGDGGIGMGDMLYSQLKDKLKNTAKITGKEGLGTIASAADAAVTTSGSTAGLFTTNSTLKPSGDKQIDVSAMGKSTFPAPSLPMGASSRMSGGATTVVKSSSTSSGATSAGASSAAPARPASVAGDVMADVEALARRIEQDYDHKLAVNGQKPEQSATTSGAGFQSDVGQTMGALGQAVASSGVSNGVSAVQARSRAADYGRTGLTLRGRKIATEG